MKGETVDIVNNLIQAVSILNKTDEYMEGLVDSLSECDSKISDYEHFIENADISKVDLIKLFFDMQETFNERRDIKKDIALRDNYRNLVGKLNNSGNREILVQNMKNAQAKLNTTYHNRILKEEDIQDLYIKIQESKKRGRPSKKAVAESE